MKKKWVIIRIETKSREFLSKSLIAYKLVKKGYGVILTNKLGVDTKVFPTGAYMINCLFSNGYNYVKKLKDNHQKVVLLDEEGLVYINEKRYLSRIDKNSLHIIDKVLCYGEDQARIIRENYPNESDKVVITGNPRMNLLNEYYRPLITSRSNAIKRKYSNYILIVSNFSIANLDGAGSNISEKRKTALKLLEKMKVDDVGNLSDHFDFVYNQMKYMQELIVSIHTQHPNIPIIIRPHPSEDINTWIDFSIGLDNVYVIRKGDLNTWILNANLVLENNCTSAIESMYMRVPCLSYRPLVDVRYDQPLPNLLSKNVFSQEEALSAVQAIVTGGRITFDFDTFEKEAKKYVSFQELDNSVDEIIKSISSLQLIETEYSSKIYRKKALSYSHLTYLLKKAAKHTIRIMPNSVIRLLPNTINNRLVAIRQDNSMNKYAGINSQSVYEVLDRISKIRNEKNNFIVKQLGEEIMIV